LPRAVPARNDGDSAAGRLTFAVHCVHAGTEFSGYAGDGIADYHPGIDVNYLGPAAVIFFFRKIPGVDAGWQQRI
jgi:hypothetical protein